MRVLVQTEPFDISSELAGVRDRTRGRAGAVVTFTGLVREMGETGKLQALTLEHYPGMTLRELEQITREAITRFDLDDVVVIHRYGELQPGDEIVAVITAASHRAAAFDAAAFLMDYLKTKAPFWKKETPEQGTERWVDARAADDAAAARWGKTRGTKK